MGTLTQHTESGQTMARSCESPESFSKQEEGMFPAQGLAGWPQGPGYWRGSPRGPEDAVGSGATEGAAFPSIWWG